MLARAEGIPLSLAAARILDTDEVTPQARRSLGNFIGDIARWRDQASALPHAELARVILDESGYTAMLQAARSAESAGRLENLNELTRAMEAYERSEEHTSELQSQMRTSYAVFCLTHNNTNIRTTTNTT